MRHKKSSNFEIARPLYKNTHSNPTLTPGNHSNPSPVVSSTRIGRQPGQSDTFSLTRKHTGWFFMCCAVPHTLSYSHQSIGRHTLPTLYTLDLSSAFSHTLPHWFLLHSLFLSLIHQYLHCHWCTHIHTITHFNFTTLLSPQEAGKMPSAAHQNGNSYPDLAYSEPKWKRGPS